MDHDFHFPSVDRIRFSWFAGLESVETETINELEFIQTLEKYNLDDLSVRELQEIARRHKLKVKGRKNELIERINLNLAK